MTQPLKIIFAGTPEFAAVALQALIDSPHNVVAVYTQPDRPAGRGRKLKPSPVKALALQHNIEVCQPATLKQSEDQQQLAAYNADLMVVAAYGLLLPEAVLNLPKYGCLNIHASLLPRWRGAAPIQRAIQEQDKETGITIMQMDVGLDTGDMLYKLATPIAEQDTAATLHDRLAQMGGEALLHTLDQLQQDKLQAEKQNDELANYAKKLIKSEAQIDWQKPARELSALVRAFNPRPVAFTPYNGEPLRIWLAEAVDETVTASPGSVVAESKAGIEVATGEGVLRILKLQLPGGKPLDSSVFLNSKTLLGKQLGQ